MAWIYLIIAGLLEIAWATGLKYSEGWTRFWPSVATVGLMIASFTLLSMAMRSLPLGTSYAVWTGIGVIGSAAIGIFIFGEPRTGARIFFLLLILVGIVGLKVTSPQH